MTASSVAFPGFRPVALAFFRELKEHNDPAWFKPNKGVYDAEVLAPLRHLVGAVGAALEEAGLPLVGDPRRGIFRIYRDVRFSPDKRLYKTHAGAVLTRSGNKRDPGLLYLHLGAGGIDGGSRFSGIPNPLSSCACGGRSSTSRMGSSRWPDASTLPATRSPATTG